MISFRPNLQKKGYASLSSSCQIVSRSSHSEVLYKNSENLRKINRENLAL